MMDATDAARPAATCGCPDLAFLSRTGPFRYLRRGVNGRLASRPSRWLLSGDGDGRPMATGIRFPAYVRAVMAPTGELSGGIGPLGTHDREGSPQPPSPSASWHKRIAALQRR